METWYRLHGTRLKPVEVHRHTDASVWITEHYWSDEPPRVVRKQRAGSYERFFPTSDEGVAFIEKHLVNRVERAKKRLNDERTLLGKFKSDVKSGRVVTKPDTPCAPLTPESF